MNDMTDGNDTAIHPLGGRFQRSVLSSLYAEALLLADEARAWFDAARGNTRGEDSLGYWPDGQDPAMRIALSCESLRLTTRIMHVIAWLLMQRAVEAGEVAPSDALLPTNRLGPNPGDGLDYRERLPVEAQKLIEASERLYARVARMDSLMDAPELAETPAPVHDLLSRISASF